MKLLNSLKFGGYLDNIYCITKAIKRLEQGTKDSLLFHKKWSCIMMWCSIVTLIYFKTQYDNTIKKINAHYNGKFGYSTTVCLNKCKIN